MRNDERWEFQYTVPRPPEGESVKLSIQEAEQCLLDQLEEQKEKPEPALWPLVQFYSQTRQHDKALERLRQLMALYEDTERRAFCVLGMGMAMEKIDDFSAAVKYYREAFAMEPENTHTWYFINNNLGYSLNKLEEFADGEQYCRAAIAIEPRRHNAHKNLGISLAGQGEFPEAARCFIQATKLNAADPRSAGHLKNLLAQRPELQAEFGKDLEMCEKAIAVAMGAAQALAGGNG